MAYEKQAMTAFAQAALAASDLINTKFAQTRFAGKVSRKVVVEAPNVESTGGGKQARESIVLKPSDGDGPSYTCGFLDVGLRSCELRSFAALDLLQRQRQQGALDLRVSEYDKFIGELRALLEAEGFVIKVVEAQDQQAKANAAAGPAERKGGNVGVMIAIGAVAAIVVVAVLVLLVMK